jgi:hypothetical protein
MIDQLLMWASVNRNPCIAGFLATAGRLCASLNVARATAGGRSRARQPR